MFEFLPQEVQDGLAAARRRASAQKTGARIEVGGHSFAVLRLGEKGFAVNTRDAAGLRGHVNLYQGGRHVGRCLIVASAQNGDETFFEFKRNTPVTDRVPLDFAPDEPAPIALPGPDL